MNLATSFSFCGWKIGAGLFERLGEQRSRRQSALPLDLAGEARQIAGWRIETGKGEEAFIHMLRRMCKHLWSSYCAFAPGAASPVESLLTYFEDEVRQHISLGKCPFS